MAKSLEISDRERKTRSRLIFLAFILFSVFILGMIYLATNPATAVTATLSYAAGLSRFTLPRTFPLVFVILSRYIASGRKKYLETRYFYGSKSPARMNIL